LNAQAAPPDFTCPTAPASSFTLNGAAGVAVAHAPSRPLRILAIGSSSTLGIGATSPSRSYPAQLAADLGSKWGIASEVRNAGVGGELVSVTEARLDVELRTYQPDLIVWQVGTNDAVTSVDLKAFRAEVEAGIATARAHNVPIILVDPQFFPGIKNAARFEAFVTAVGDVGAKAHVPVFSRFAMMKAWAAQSADLLRASLSPDGFHMGDKGYACWAEALAQDIARERAGKSAAVNAVPSGAKL
jgi:acyl-CoA thioesterase-1